MKKMRNPLPYLIYFGLPAASVVIYALIFHAKIADIIYPILSYRGIYGFFGLGIITSQFFPMAKGAHSQIIKIVSNLALIGVMIASLKLSYKNILDSNGICQKFSSRRRILRIKTQTQTIILCC